MERKHASDAKSNLPNYPIINLNTGTQEHFVPETHMNSSQNKYFKIVIFAFTLNYPLLKIN